MISVGQLDEYLDYTRAATAREQIDISIDTMALRAILVELKHRREITAYMKAGYKSDNVFVQRMIAAAENS